MIFIAPSKAPSRDFCALGQRLKFRSLDLRMNAIAQSAIGARNHARRTDCVGPQSDSPCNQIGMLNRIRRVSHYTGQNDSAAEIDALPISELVLMSSIRGFHGPTP